MPLCDAGAVSANHILALSAVPVGVCQEGVLEGDMETGGGRVDLLFPICFPSLLCFFLYVLLPINVTLVPLDIPLPTGQRQMISAPPLQFCKVPLPSVCFNNYSVFPWFPSAKGVANSHSCHFCDTVVQGLATCFLKGHIVNTLGLQTTWSLLELLSSALAVRKQP